MNCPLEAHLIEHLFGRGVEDFVEEPPHVRGGCSGDEGNLPQTGIFRHVLAVPFECFADALVGQAVAFLRHGHRLVFAEEQTQFEEDLLEVKHHTGGGMLPVTGGLVGECAKAAAGGFSDRDVQVTRAVAELPQGFGNRLKMKNGYLGGLAFFPEPAVLMAGWEQPEPSRTQQFRSLRKMHADAAAQNGLEFPELATVDADGMFGVLTGTEIDVAKHADIVGL